MAGRTQKGAEGTNRRNPDGVLDPKSGIQIVLSAKDHFVNEGAVYHITGSASLASATSAFLELRIPANVEVHIEELSIWTTIPLLDVRLLENPTIGTPGTNEVPIVNRNRSHTVADLASQVEAFDNPVAVSDGDMVLLRRTGAAVKARTEKLVESTKLILGDKADPSIYTIEFENVNADQGELGYELVWHEIESGE